MIIYFFADYFKSQKYIFFQKRLKSYKIATETVKKMPIKDLDK